ncbi:uncharacterized protein PHALS_14231 [Plasmopara halstedii]|uniref:Uncharacterized protein n=1 Tax=Plasmopara halstedii TaxID=4781 RepID=A0A0P1ARF4_PLAHL|nr:uncharacterized protein PHALS_14231 [Plasmopara halstedii]CEG43954.1 hypothetical protein PHALS_14231 [Plasmopara halstedii]|eukprot:XP_024580323.1 hypothetical protein PHALS_14231 [Plasmopara halstedii]
MISPLSAASIRRNQLSELTPTANYQSQPARRLGTGISADDSEERLNQDLKFLKLLFSRIIPEPKHGKIPKWYVKWLNGKETHRQTVLQHWNKKMNLPVSEGAATALLVLTLRHDKVKTTLNVIVLCERARSHVDGAPYACQRDQKFQMSDKTAQLIIWTMQAEILDTATHEAKI